MKYIINSVFTILTIVTIFVTIAACGNNDETGEYRQSVILPATQTYKTIELISLDAEISRIEGGADWLTVRTNSYQSGNPSIILAVTDNMSEVTRICVLILYTTKGDKLLLTVSQEGADPINDSIEDSHDIVTDQPAYSRSE